MLSIKCLGTFSKHDIAENRFTEICSFSGTSEYSAKMPGQKRNTRMRVRMKTPKRKKNIKCLRGTYIIEMK